MLKKTDVVFTKDSFRAPSTTVRTTVPTILKHEVRDGDYWVLVVAKYKSGLKLTRFRQVPIPNGKWFKTNKNIVQHLMGQTVTNHVWVLPLGMHPKDIGIVE